ncbi:MAG: DUF4286 family protein [Bacteroidetes bacterium]|nr:DUF4286 family protein [Bacteroidota bacterium]
MIVYNVTINVHDEVCDDWLKWMKETHLPQVMATDMFEKYTLFKLLTRQEEEEGSTFVIQYACSTMEKYDHYMKEFAPALREETNKKFAGKFFAFRSLMELVQ